jgi:hypothetical protein
MGIVSGRYYMLTENVKTFSAKFSLLLCTVSGDGRWGDRSLLRNGELCRLLLWWYRSTIL